MAKVAIISGLSVLLLDVFGKNTLKWGWDSMIGLQNT